MRQQGLRVEFGWWKMSRVEVFDRVLATLLPWSRVITDHILVIIIRFSPALPLSSRLKNRNTMQQVRIFCFLFMLLSFGVAQAQVPTPAPAQSVPIVLRNATIHTGTGEVIEKGAIAFSEGKITFVGKDADFTPSANTQSIDAGGKHIYPGLILLDTYLGLEEISQVAATQDQQETGSFNPEVRAIVAYNTDSHLPPTLRANGILMAQIVPQGGLVSGTSSVVQLDAWNWEDAAVNMDEGIHFNFPRKMLPPRWWLNETASRENKRYKPTLEALETALRDGKAYTEKKGGDTNLKLESMRGLYDGKKIAYLHVNYAEGIVKGIQILKKYGVKKVVLVGGAEALYVKDFLKQESIPVVLRNVHSLPYGADKATEEPYQTPYLLHQAGVTVALGYSDPMNSRNLAFFAGTAAAFGMDKEEALQLITKNAAEVLGLEAHVGTLEIGKEATLLLSAGDLLDMRGNAVEKAYISGRDISLDDKHKQLYQKFKQKYEQQK
ncbi:MAG: amidohydrolase family protein [Bacteroidota bacterium]